MKTMETTKDKSAALKKVQRVIEMVAASFAVDVSDLVSPDQGNRAVSTARYVACYLLRDTIDCSQAAAILGRRTYNYAYGASKWVKRRMDEDAGFFRKVLKLEDAVL